jgi:hypothetical protein
VSKDVNIIVETQSLQSSDTAVCRHSFSAPKHLQGRRTVIYCLEHLQHARTDAVILRPSPTIKRYDWRDIYVHVLVHHQPEQDSRFTTCDMHPLYINDDTASYLSSPRVPNLAGKNALHLVAIAWRCSLIVPKKSQSNNQTPEMLLNHDPFHMSTRQRYELHLCRSSPSAFAFPKLPRSNRVDGCQVL